VLYLTGGVPELETDSPVLEIHCLAQKVDADRCLVGIIKSIVHESVC